MTPSELEIKREECRRNLETLKAALAKTKKDFSAQIEDEAQKVIRDREKVLADLTKSSESEKDRQARQVAADE